ncbi:predicted protein [Nematostella vectensis]|uniref:Transcriptional protein SWT1 n=1 Tax=Nematostella vectensis TaxID=45351 RepID=A7SYI2_NEMVE|nr:predicted protein [Nematostella vectensis]|eukprot:XP_001623323.1 predicted protein [Nematostella vectensis]
MASDPVSSEMRPLPNGWIMKESSSRPGRKYFFHKMSGMTSWKHPLDLSHKDKHALRRKPPKRERNIESSSMTSSIIEDLAKRRKSSPITSPELKSPSQGSHTSKHSQRSSTKQPSHISPGKAPKRITSRVLKTHTIRTAKEKPPGAKKPCVTSQIPAEISCSKTRACHIANWLSSVDNSFEPNDAGSNISGGPDHKKREKSSVKKVPEAAEKQPIFSGRINHQKKDERQSVQSPNDTVLQKNLQSNSAHKGRIRTFSAGSRETDTSSKGHVRTFSSGSRANSISPTSPPIGFTPFGQLTQQAPTSSGHKSKAHITSNHGSHNQGPTINGTTSPNTKIQAAQVPNNHGNHSRELNSQDNCTHGNQNNQGNQVIDTQSLSDTKDVSQNQGKLEYVAKRSVPMNVDVVVSSPSKPLKSELHAPMESTPITGAGQFQIPTCLSGQLTGMHSTPQVDVVSGGSMSSGNFFYSPLRVNEQVGQHDSGYDDTIDMEVDNCEELQESIMRESTVSHLILIQSIEKTFSSTGFTTSSHRFLLRKGEGNLKNLAGVDNDSWLIASDSSKTKPEHSYSDVLYIILDTNILLSHLKFITELKDFPIEGVGRPVLIVPWIVMQELDSLKSDSWKFRKGKIINAENKESQRGVDAQARQAVRFLHSCFEANHPRIRGQTLAESLEHVSDLPEESNDDRILHCCLMFQMKASNGNAVLFSNDQNLCSKAMINGVRAFRSHNLIDGLRDMFKNKEIVVRADYFSDYYDELKAQEVLAERRAKADDIVCELQCIMREGLAVIVETEMRAAYEHLWHWIAVFGDVIKRSMHSTVKDLKKLFDPQKGCIANASKLLLTSQSLMDAFAQRSSYNGAVTKCVAAIHVLKKKCEDSKEPSPPPNPVTSQAAIQAKPIYHALPPAMPQSQTETSSVILGEGSTPSSDETASIASGSIHGEINTVSIRKPYEDVLSAFDVIWNAVNQFSAQIFNALSYPHNIPLSLENLPKPTKEEAITFLNRLAPCLSSLVSALQLVLQLPIEQLSSSPQPFLSLQSAISRFHQEILNLGCPVTSQALCVFCQDPNSSDLQPEIIDQWQLLTCLILKGPMRHAVAYSPQGFFFASERSALIQGLSQLDRALAMLQHCWVCVRQA